MHPVTRPWEIRTEKTHKHLLRSSLLPAKMRCVGAPYLRRVCPQGRRKVCARFKLGALVVASHFTSEGVTSPGPLGCCRDARRTVPTASKRQRLPFKRLVGSALRNTTLPSPVGNEKVTFISHGSVHANQFLTGFLHPGIALSRDAVILSAPELLWMKMCLKDRPGSVWMRRRALR